MFKCTVSGYLLTSLLLPDLAWAGPNEDLAKGMIQGKADLVEQAILHGANPNEVINFSESEQWALLLWSAGSGYLEVVQVLLENGADLNVKDNNGRSALWWAVFGGHLDVVKLLLEKGVDPNAKNKDGKTALDLARENNQTDVVNYLSKLK